MENLKEIRIRITSVGSTMQITSAMKMVSAAKLKRAQDAIIQMRPYSNKLTELLVNLSSTLDSSEGGMYSQKREEKRILLVTITSNRGLCGGFNANIIKKATSLIQNEYKNSKTDILSIGKKSSDYFIKNGFNVISRHDDLYSDLNFENTSIIAETIMEKFTNVEYDKIVLVYNQFKNAATQNIMSEQFLPVESPDKTESKIGDYIFEPNKSEIVEQLIPKSLKT